MNQPDSNQSIDPQYSLLMRAARDRDLTAEELSQLDGFLAQNQAELAEFEAVDQVLANLPDVAVPSNFTARVLEEAQRQDQPAPRLAKRMACRYGSGCLRRSIAQFNWLLLRLWLCLSEFLLPKPH